MNKKELDEYFVSQIPQMEDIIKKIIWKYRKNLLEPSLVINECYLHLTECVTEDMSKKMVKSIIVNFTNQNIYWKNSKMNKQERNAKIYDERKTKQLKDKERDFEEFNHILSHVNDSEKDFEYYNRMNMIDSSEEDIDDKIQIEDWLNERQGICELYYQQEQDRIKKIIYECYFRKNITKAVNLAKHLGISKYHSQKYYRELKQDIFNYYKEYKKTI